MQYDYPTEFRRDAYGSVDTTYYVVEAHRLRSVHLRQLFARMWQRLRPNGSTRTETQESLAFGK